MKSILMTLGLASMTNMVTATEVVKPTVVETPSLISALTAKAGENKEEIIKALKQVPAEQRKGMQFLITHMPAEDLKSLTADFLLENVAYAYKARAEFPWAKEIPEDIFLNDVLPYAHLNERRDNWRKDFYERFSEHVKDAKTFEDAMYAVNKAIKDEVKVEYNTKRKKPDQSPYESMEQGMASCTGLSILLADAFRAVGIPARVAGIPLWTTKRGNHNWVEIWTPSDQQWHFTEYYPDAKGLDHSWFVADAVKANPKSFYHSIYASSWKPTGIHFPLVWNMHSKMVHAVNVTERYVAMGKKDEGGVDLCDLRIDFTAEDGTRSEIEVMVMQADVEIGKGVTPKATDDMNKHLTIAVPRGQMYQVIWRKPGSKKQEHQSVTVKHDAEFLRVPLK